MKTPSTMVTVVIKDVLGVYMLVGGGIVLGSIFLLIECLYFTRRLVKHPNTVSSSTAQRRPRNIAVSTCRVALDPLLIDHRNETAA